MVSIEGHEGLTPFFCGLFTAFFLFIPQSIDTRVMMKRIACIAAMLLTICFVSPTFAQTLTVGCGADRYSKAESYLTFCKWDPNAWITEPLVSRGADYSPIPGLIEHWENNGHTYRLHLRKGIQFHNGDRFDATAVKHSLSLYSQNRSEFLRIDPDSYQILDPYTLEFTSSQETIHFIGLLSHPFVACYAPGTDAVNAPVGTGPFVFKEYHRDRYLKVTRNETYWGEKPPNQEVIFRFISDPQARTMALLNGEVDIAYPVATQSLMALPPKGDYRVIVSPLNSYLLMTVNIHGEPPFDTLRDERVRKALALAIHRETIADVAYLGKAKPAKTFLAPWFWNQGDNFLNGYGFEPDQAAQLLEQAGWEMASDGLRYKAGRPLKLRLVSGWPNASTLKPVPELLQQMFRKIGVDLELIQTDDDGVYYGNYMGPGKGDLFLEKASNTGLTPDWLLYMLYHSQTPWLDSGYKWSLPGKRFDHYVDLIRGTSDTQAVIENLQQAQRVLVDQVCAIIPLLYVPDIYLVRKNIRFNPDAGGGYVKLGYAQKIIP